MLLSIVELHFGSLLQPSFLLRGKTSRLNGPYPTEIVPAAGAKAYGLETRLDQGSCEKTHSPRGQIPF